MWEKPTPGCPCRPDVEQQVEQDRGDGAEGDAARDDRPHILVEPAGDRRVDGRRDREAEAGRQDDDVALLVEVHPTQRLIPTTATVPNRRCRRRRGRQQGNCGHDRADLRDHADDHHEHAGGGHDVPALDPSEPDREPHILGKAGVREGVEDAADRRREPVGADGAGDVVAVELLLDDLPGCEDVTGRLHGR